MGKFVNCECFKGFHKLAVNCYNGNHINEFIEQYELEYLQELLGCELAQQLCEYIESDRTPLNPDLELIIEPFCKSNSSSCCKCVCKRCEIKSKGLKWMLTGFIYYHIASNQTSFNTGIGAVKPKGGKGEKLKHYNNEREAEKRYNDAVCTYQAIQECIRLEKKICSKEEQPYNNFNGCYKEVKLLDII